MGAIFHFSHYRGATGRTTIIGPLMSDIDSIRKKAAERGRQKGLPYAGALTPAEAHALMQAGAKLVDVRTDAEVHYVGGVPGSDHIEWSSFPDGHQNPHFLEQLENTAGKDETVLFLCRSGVRSHNAAVVAAKAGWGEAYNILEGFEGDKNAEGHRSTVGGWRKAGLPWIQS
jgi:rhodanese-related sulfurtransferase